MHQFAHINIFDKIKKDDNIATLIDVSSPKEPMFTKPRALIADDNLIMRETLRMLLKKEFDVDTVDSGQACLDLLAREKMDLVLLDIMMPGIDGYETCRLLREANQDVPVIFVSAMDTLEERLRAFDNGGNDFIRKPFDAQVLLRKALKAVELYGDRKRLASEKDSLQKMAMGFLKNVGETGILLNFMREMMGSVSYEALAKGLVEAAHEYGLNCHAQVRQGAESVSWTASGPASELELSILEKSSKMGRIFEFSNRLVVNHECVTLLVNDLPEDPEMRGRIRDNVAILVDSAEAIAETVGLRKQAAAQNAMMLLASANSHGAIERMREMYRRQQMDMRLQLQSLVDEVENSYTYLALSTAQEESMSITVQGGANRIIEVIESSSEFELEFSTILSALAGDRQVM
jgi:CheY-like chemotaxis protein